MVVRPALVLTLLMFALTAGCLDDNTTSQPSIHSIPAGEAPTGPGAGTATGHGAAKMQESPATISQQSGKYVARKTVTYSNDFGAAANADVTLTTRVGGVAFDDWSSGGYQVVATLQGKGSTEQEARANLARLKVTHSDRLSAGKLTLVSEVQFPSNSNDLSGTLLAQLPASPSYRLVGTTNTGGASAHGLGGPTVTLTTNTGGVQASGGFNTANLKANTGGIVLDGIFNVVKATTGTGGVDGQIQSTSSGSIQMSADTGGVKLVLDDDGNNGYDVAADVGTGGINIAIGSTENVGSQSNGHKHVRTTGYSEAAIRVTVDLSTGTGGVTASR